MATFYCLQNQNKCIENFHFWTNCSIKLNFSKKSLLNDQVNLRKSCTVSFQGCHDQFLGSIKQPGLDIWKKSILNDQYHLILSNSRSLEQPGLIIESLEYFNLPNNCVGPINRVSTGYLILKCEK